MKTRFAWASAAALAVVLGSQVEAKALTNGVIVITTRTAIDAFWRQQSSSSLWDADDNKGPGSYSPGDVAMGSLLGDNGYVTRMVPERALWNTTTDWLGAATVPEYYYGGGGGPSSTATNDLFSASLVIVSGSGSSADMPPVNTNGIPIIMGEHSCVGDVTLAGGSSLFLYGNKNNNSANWGLAQNPGLYMKVLAPDHPIMKGIPLDAQGRVQIWRDPYPEENAHIPAGGKPNYEINWTTVDLSAGKAVAAPGLTVIGTLDDPNTNRAVFAVIEAGAAIIEVTDAAHPWFGAKTAPSRLVHLFVNEDGSGGSRRCFNALTSLGRTIFLRTCKWAMGETLEPYQGLGIIDIGLVGPYRIKLSWQGLPDKNFRIVGTTDFTNWTSVVDSIIGGTNATVSRTLDISGAPKAAFMRVAAMP